MFTFPISGYLTVHELSQGAQALVKAHPDVRLRRLGYSRAGIPLLLLSTGRGSRNILTVAGAHANEPVGTAGSLYLAEFFASQSDVLEEMDCTWHFLLCLDPDGAKLNEEWVRETPSLGRYFQGFYRPATASQPEFLPVAGDDRPTIPESKILIALLDELRPAIQFSLHGHEVGGSFIQLTSAVPEAARTFRELSAELDIPLEYRPYDGIDWIVESPGVLFLSNENAVNERDPAGFSSRTTWTYPIQYDTISVIVEAPMWAAAGVSDPRPVSCPAEEILRVSEILTDRTQQVRELLECGGVDLSGDSSPFLVAAQELLSASSGVVETWKNYEPRGRDASGLAATVGNSISLGIAARRLPLRAAAMVRRALTAVSRGSEGASLALKDMVSDWCRELGTSFEIKPVPVHHQIELQARTMREIAHLVFAAKSE